MNYQGKGKLIVTTKYLSTLAVCCNFNIVKSTPALLIMTLITNFI